MFLDRECVERGERKAKEKSDSAVKHDKGVAKGTLQFVGSTDCPARIRYSPMRRHRLATPNGADFARRTVANREDKLHFRCAWLGKFIPAFAAQIGCGEPGTLDLLQRVRIHVPNRMAARAVCDKLRLAAIT